MGISTSACDMAKEIFRLTSVGLLLMTDVSIGLPWLEIRRPETVMYAEDFGHIPRLFCAKRMRIDSCVCVSGGYCGFNV